MRWTVGLLLVLTPFIGIAVVSLVAQGLLGTALVFGLSVATMVVLWAGIALMEPYT